MAQQQQKVPKGGKNVARGVRTRAYQLAQRPHHIAHSRMVHEHNALHCCGAKFAAELHKQYVLNSNPGKKHGKKKAKKFN